MTVLSILQRGDPRLRFHAHTVPFVPNSDLFPNSELAQLARDMADTMFANNGIGLAATQVGRLERLIVVSLDGPRALRVFVNPVIFEKADVQRSVEGCLSVPRAEWNQAVTRAKRIRVVYQNLLGETCRTKAHGNLAAVIQHEIDHLDGILFTDYLQAPGGTVR